MAGDRVKIPLKKVLDLTEQLAYSRVNDMKNPNIESEAAFAAKTFSREEIETKINGLVNTLTARDAKGGWLPGQREANIAWR